METPSTSRPSGWLAAAIVAVVNVPPPAGTVPVISVPTATPEPFSSWIRYAFPAHALFTPESPTAVTRYAAGVTVVFQAVGTVSYTHLRAHETDSYLVCR